MNITAKCLIESQYAPATDTTVYTTPGSTHTIVDKFTATNTDSASQTLSVNIIPSGGSVGASNLVLKTVSIAAGATFDSQEMKNQILNAGDLISVVASTASKIVVRMSGREIT